MSTPSSGACRVVAAVLLVCSSASCWQGALRPDPPFAPQVFFEPPRLDQVIATVNQNTAAIRQLQAENATLSMAGFPAWRARLDLEPPRRFRLRGKWIGPEIDLGSNDEQFWVWIRRNPEPAIYYAHHDQLTDTGGSPLAVDPELLIEAFGLVSFAPRDQHTGPFPRDEGRIEIRSQLRRRTGPVSRSVVVDGTYGWILEQTYQDANGNRLATVKASRHQYEPLEGVSLPHRVEIEFAAGQASLAIDVGRYYINRVADDPAELWTMPSPEGFTPVNLLELSARPTWTPPPPQTSHAPRTIFRPQYRGYTR